MTTPVSAGARLYSRDYLLTWLATAVFASSFYLLLQAFPLYLRQREAQPWQIGVIVGVFSVTAIVVNPFVGRASDTYGRRRIMLLGALLFTAADLLYLVAQDLVSLVPARLIHGLGMASFMTSSATFVADISPRHRLGEAIAVHSIALNFAVAITPVLGLWLLALNPAWVFATAAALAILAFALVILLSPRAGVPSTPKRKLRAAPLLPFTALHPCFVFLSITITWGSLVTFLPLLGTERHITFGLFFPVYAVMGLLVRAGSGPLADRLGRTAVIVPGMLSTTVALWLLSITSTDTLLVGVGVLYGVGLPMTNVGFQALVIDRVRPQERGTAMGIFGATFDLGNLLGALTSGAFLQWSDFFALYLLMGALPLAALAFYLLTQQGIRSSPIRSEPESSEGNSL